MHEPCEDQEQPCISIGRVWRIRDIHPTASPSLNSSSHVYTSLIYNPISVPCHLRTPTVCVYAVIVHTSCNQFEFLRHALHPAVDLRGERALGILSLEVSRAQMQNRAGQVGPKRTISCCGSRVVTKEGFNDDDTVHIWPSCSTLHIPWRWSLAGIAAKPNHIMICCGTPIPITLEQWSSDLFSFLSLIPLVLKLTLALDYCQWLVNVGPIYEEHAGSTINAWEIYHFSLDVTVRDAK